MGLITPHTCRLSGAKRKKQAAKEQHGTSAHNQLKIRPILLRRGVGHCLSNLLRLLHNLIELFVGQIAALEQGLRLVGLHVQDFHLAHDDRTIGVHGPIQALPGKVGEIPVVHVIVLIMRCQRASCHC